MLLGNREQPSIESTW